MPSGIPTLRQVVLDSDEARRLAEFYRELLGYAYRVGDEPPPPGEPDPRAEEWLVLLGPGRTRLAIQPVPRLARTTWPDETVPQQLHLDLTVSSLEELDAAHRRALDLGAVLALDRSAHPEEPLRVYRDPSGHPFCIFVVPPGV